MTVVIKAYFNQQKKHTSKSKISLLYENVEKSALEYRTDLQLYFGNCLQMNFKPRVYHLHVSDVTSNSTQPETGCRYKVIRVRGTRLSGKRVFEEFLLKDFTVIRQT